MQFKLPATKLLEYQAQRALAILTAETAKKGYAELEDFTNHLDLTQEELIPIRDLLISRGELEIIP